MSVHGIFIADKGQKRMCLAFGCWVLRELWDLQMEVPNQQWELRARLGKLGLCRPKPALSLFLQIKFYWNIAMLIGLHTV